MDISIQEIIHSPNLPEIITELNRVWSEEQRRREEFYNWVTPDIKADKNSRVVHQPVHPVEVGIMHESHEGESNNKIQDSLLVYVPVKFCMAGHFWTTQNEGRNKGHNKYSKNRKNDLPGIIFKLGKPLLNFF